jgi:hypothetical protein
MSRSNEALKSAQRVTIGELASAYFYPVQPRLVHF